MAAHHAALWLGPDSARVLSFNGKSRHFDPSCYRAADYVAADAGQVPDPQRSLYADVCDAMSDVPALLVTGPGTLPDEFMLFVAERHPEMRDRIVGVQRVEAPVERRLMALARWHFSRPPDPVPSEQP